MMQYTLSKKLLYKILNTPKTSNKDTKTVVLYNFDFKTQKIELLHRGGEFPREYREYPRLWRVKDKERNTETIIISI